jgi:cyclic pyranopterin phosphate synthase
MPAEIFNKEYKFLARDLLLSFEEIALVAGAFETLGVDKLRLTGGEPLLRRNLEDLIAMLSAETDTEVTLTTNGSLLARKAEALVSAGLKRVTVSLDSVDEGVFQAMNDVGFPVADVLSGIDAAAEAGLSVKVNAVVKRGVNDHEVVALAKHFKGTGHIVRFIEFMDVGVTNGWRLDDVVPATELVAAVNKVFPIEPAEPNYTGEVAARWRYKDGDGEIGFITSVTQPFCSTCTRARISAEGMLYTCLFATSGTDLRALLREGADQQSIASAVGDLWSTRVDRYSELRSEATVDLPKVEMSYIGG